MSLRGRALVPIGGRYRIRGHPEPTIEHVSQTKLRGGDARYSRQLQSLARNGVVSRPRMPVQIDRANNAVSFSDAVSRGLVQPTQRLRRIGLDFEAGREQGLRVPLRQFGVAHRRRAPPFRDSPAQRSVQEDETEAELRLCVAALRSLSVPLHRLGEIALDPLASDIELCYQKRRLARTSRAGGPPTSQRGGEAPSRIGRITTVHVTRSARTSDHRSRRETCGEHGAAHGSRIASPAP